MKYKIISLIGIFLLLHLSVLHAEQVLTLKDGSQIKGELMSVKEGVYTVKTPIIGEIQIAAANVVNISNGAQPAPSAITTTTSTEMLPGTTGTNRLPTKDDFNQQVMLRQQQLANDPQAMGQLQQLAQDPEIMSILADPELIRAVSSHDPEAVRKNSKAQKLMNNPKMQALIQQLQGQTGTSSN